MCSVRRFLFSYLVDIAVVVTRISFSSSRCSFGRFVRSCLPSRSLIAQRKCYGSQSRKAVIPEDTTPEAIWRWEVQLMDLLPTEKVSICVCVLLFCDDRDNQLTNEKT